MSIIMGPVNVVNIVNVAGQTGSADLGSSGGCKLLIPIYRCPGDPQLLIATRLGEKAIGAENQLELSRAFSKSIVWLLTGEEARLRK
jgi:hypothetical protein